MSSQYRMTIATLCFLFCQSFANAQETDSGVFVLEFGGGTLTEYVQFIQTKPNYNNEGEQKMLNLVVMPTAANVYIPRINIVTNTSGAVGLLDGYKSGSVTLAVKSDPTGNLRRIEAEYSEPFGVTVINCRQLLNSENAVSDLIDAVEFGLEMSGTKVEIKLHEKTGLLFAKGPSAATQLVVETIQQLAYASGVQLQGPGEKLQTWKPNEEESKDDVITPSKGRVSGEKSE